MIKNIIFTGDATEIPRQIEIYRKNLEANGKKVISVETYRVECGGYYIIEICNDGPREPVETSRFIEDKRGNIYKIVYSNTGEYDEERYVSADVYSLSDIGDERSSCLLAIQHDATSFEWILKEGSIAVWDLVDRTILSDELNKVFGIKFN